MASTNGNVHLIRQLQDQCLADSKKWFPAVSASPNEYGEVGEADLIKALVHHTLSMCGETGEVANLVKKIERGDRDLRNELTAFDLRDEVTDVFIYLLNIAGLLQMDLLKEYLRKRTANEKRFAK